MVTIDKNGNETSNGGATHVKFRLKELAVIISVLSLLSTCSTTCVVGSAKYYVDSETQKAIAPLNTHVEVAKKRASTVDADLVTIKKDMADVKTGIAVLDSSVKILMSPRQRAKATSMPPGMMTTVPKLPPSKVP